MWPSLTAAIVASKSAWPLKIILTVSGSRSRTLARNCAPFMAGMRISETTTAKGPLSPIRRSASAPLEAVCSSTCLRSVR